VPPASRPSTDEGLDVATFAVEDVAEGRGTSWDDGRLIIDLGAVEALAAGSSGVRRMQAEIVRPGQPVRLVNVLDAVDPVVKKNAPETTFPGASGELAGAGTGVSHRLDGVAVLSLADFRATHDVDALACSPDGDGVIDMAGPGAYLSPWSATTNLVLTFACDPGVSLADVDRSVRALTLRVARDLAAATVAAMPAAVESFALRPARASLPAVCVILQVAAEGPLTDTFFYGRSVEGILPTLVDPREILDGAMTSGQYDWAGSRNPTAFYQRSVLLRELLGRHGRDLRFAGVILALGYLPSARDKERSALLAARLAKRIGAEAAVLTTFQTGNSHTDTVLTAQACERLGVSTVVLFAETDAGLTDRAPETDCVVSTGNEEELVPEWRPKSVLGGEMTYSGRSAMDAGRLPVVEYLGAVSQMGDMKLRAVTW
jgi:sarcosine reductase